MATILITSAVEAVARVLCISHLVKTGTLYAAAAIQSNTDWPNYTGEAKTLMRPVFDEIANDGNDTDETAPTDGPETTPREPTEAMISAGLGTDFPIMRHAMKNTHLIQLWQAMHDAA